MTDETINPKLGQTEITNIKDIITMKTFIQNMTYLIKLAIYANKGTTDENMLKRCINFYNKYKVIESKDVMSGQETTYVRKCIKRLNMILKIDKNGNPVDIDNKENQRLIIKLIPNNSVLEDNLDKMLSFANENNLMIFPNIPFDFVLKSGKYQQLCWQCVRTLFFISQILLIDANSEFIILDESLNNLQKSIELSQKLQEKFKIEQLLSADNFLKSKLITVKTDKNNIGQAIHAVKGLFAEEGLETSPTLSKLLDGIGERLEDKDLANDPNLIGTLWGIANNFATEMKDDIMKNPGDIQKAMGSITQLLNKHVNDEDNKLNMPPQFKQLFGMVSKIAIDPQNINENEEDAEKMLESVLAPLGLNKSDISDKDGVPDISKLMTLTGLKESTN